MGSGHRMAVEQSNRREICIQDWLQAESVITLRQYQGVTGLSPGKRRSPGAPQTCTTLHSQAPVGSLTPHFLYVKAGQGAGLTYPSHAYPV